MSIARTTIAALSLALLAGQALGQTDAAKPIPLTKPAQDVKKLPEKMPEEVKKQAQEPLPAPVGDPGELSFEKRKVDFGTISDESPQTTKFVFTNIGKGTLQLGQPRGSCGCTVPNLTKLSYEPGESGEIEVTFNPKGKPTGKAHTTITVTSNDPKNPTITLDIEADIRPVFRADPMMINAGQAQRGQTLTQKLSILSRKTDVVVTQASPSSPRLTTKVLPPQQVTENGETLTKTEIEVTVPEGATAGPLQENITVRTNDPARFATVYVTGEILGLIQPSPNQLNIPMLAMGQQINSTVRLTPRAGKPFKITGVMDEPVAGAMGQIFKFEVKEDTSAVPSAWMITGTGSAPNQPGRVSGEWVVSTDLPEEPTIRIRYNGFVRQQQNQAQDPAWQQNPSSLTPTGG
ncbi:MAG TPA: DUF1573 domain-containing protein [Phycisphaerales bacterium]|nr:DUF1573 domain-containing protein [Phycisphaerales bacterium]